MSNNDNKDYIGDDDDRTLTLEGKENLYILNAIII